MATQGSPAITHSPKSLLDFFTSAFDTFAASEDVFRVLCTIPHQSQDGPPAPRPLQAPRPRERPMRFLLILDSSFNPPTKAHMKMVRESAREYGHWPPARLLLLLSVQNADKQPMPASFPQRLCMMEAFAREALGEEVATVDIALTTKPFFHDKGREIINSGFYPEVREQIFIAGYDTLVRIFDPKYYPNGSMMDALDAFFHKARLRVTLRPNDELGKVEAQDDYVEALKDGSMLERIGGRPDWAKEVQIALEEAGGEISSTKARALIKSGGGGDLGELVGEEIKAWIEREGLYKDA